MNRLERFRTARRFKRRYTSLFLLFFFIITFGLCIVDYSTNWLLKNQKSIQLIGFYMEGAFLEVKILDESLKIDVSVILNDLERLKQRFARE
ncbi:MAG TPA: hypothetical protein GXX20_00835 [Clostridiaceae bacterium]|nr:hypothetical protein [Clostridiaceae bacterium]